MNKVREQLKEKQIMQEMEQKKKDKLDDQKARAAIKAQIEADKKARAERTAREKALREGRPITDNMAENAPGPSAAPAPATSTASSVPGKEFKETRLQIRMSTGGTPYTTSLSSDARKLLLC